MRAKLQEAERLDSWIKTELHRTADLKAAALKIMFTLNSVDKTADILHIPTSTLYEWIREWNEHKEASLKSRQGFGGGRPSKLTQPMKEQFKHALKKNEVKSIDQARLLLKEMFAVEYSSKQVSRILRGLGLKTSFLFF